MFRLLLGTLILSRLISNLSTMDTPRPKLIVFDLDYTLWPFWVDTHVNPPFKIDGTSQIVDSSGTRIRVYPEVPEILRRLHSENYELGIASRTSEIQGALQLIKLFDWDKYFKYKEIYTGTKRTHFATLKKKSGFDYCDMLFFDDESRNIVDVSRLGVTSILVQNGMCMSILNSGLEEYAAKHH